MIGIMSTYGTLRINEPVTFMIATASLILEQQHNTIKRKRPSRPQIPYPVY
jgi:hypothetical protein